MRVDANIITYKHLHFPNNISAISKFFTIFFIDFMAKSIDNKGLKEYNRNVIWIDFKEKIMAGLKKTLFFGYSKSSVHQTLNAQKRYYTEKIQELESLNANFKRTIERYQEKEMFISEALTEAKRIAKNILADSEVQAEEMVRLTKEDLAERVRNTEEKFRRLEEAKQAIVEHEEFMKVELKQLLNRQMDMIENIEIGFDEAEIHADTLIANSQYDLEEVRQVALGDAHIDQDTGKVVHFPERVESANAYAAPAKVAVDYSVAESTGTDHNIPVYSLEDF